MPLAKLNLHARTWAKTLRAARETGIPVAAYVNRVLTDHFEEANDPFRHCEGCTRYLFCTFRFEECPLDNGDAQ